jgi:hypothetical protein
MSCSRRNTCWKAWRRRCTAGLTLAAYLAASLGLPFPVVAAPPIETEAQPAACQDRPACCCRTGGQGGSCCCCSSDQHQPRKARQDNDSGPAREGPAAPGTAVAPNEGAQAPARGSVHWMPGVTALQCRGLGTLWVSTAAALPPAPPVVWTPFWDVAGWLCCLSDRPTNLSSTPPDPPPRFDGV